MVMRQELQVIEGISGLVSLGDFWLVRGEEVIESKESVWSISVMVISSEGSSLISAVGRFLIEMIRLLASFGQGLLTLEDFARAAGAWKSLLGLIVIEVKGAIEDVL